MLDSVWAWVVRLVAVAGLGVVGWVCLTAWPAVVHGHPVYAVLLIVTALAFGVLGVRSLGRRTTAVAWWRSLLRALLLLGSGVWLGAVAFLRPFAAQEPALAAMASDAAVRVSESSTQIVFSPTGATDATAVFFQPGARVDARAYAAVLRPLAEAGHVVVLAKQPLGVGFLAGGAFERARAARPGIDAWVVGGHSLGGVIAATNADAHDADPSGRVSGLLLFASYPASDLSQTLSCPVLSLSGGADGLTTPTLVAQTKARLPAGTTFTVIDGAVHAFFGDYGSQPGDGTPSVSRDDARSRISAESVAFVGRI